MRKKIFMILAAMALMICVPQHADAQFFKKLGQALDKVDKALDAMVGDTGQGDAATTKQGTAAAAEKSSVKPFKGIWYSDVLHLDIDFYGNSVLNPFTMDDEYCPGVITLLADNGSTSFDIAEAKIAGNKVTAKTSDEAVVAMELLADGNMKVTLPEMVLVTLEEDKTFKGDYIVKRGGPFVGKWTFKSGGSEGALTLDLYGQSVVDESNGSANYGIMYVGYGMKTDNCVITRWQEDGNNVKVTFVGGRDGGTRTAVLTYDPTTAKISVSNVTEVSDCSECYVTDGLTFAKSQR